MATVTRDIRTIVERQQQWWARENERPLVGTFAPVRTPCGGYDFEVDPASIVERKLANLEASSVIPADNLPTARVEFGTSFLPALAGAEYDYDGHTSWSIPCAGSAAELEIRPFDPAHPLWRRFVERFAPLCEGWSWQTYLPSPAVMVGPMDVLSAMLGPETLAMELYADPDAVRSRAMEAAGLFMEVYEAQLAMIRDAGLTEGVADWMSTWMPGWGICYSEDFAALVGEAHFRQFFHEPNRYLIERLDTPYLHLHSGALSCLPAVLDLGLAALELSNDPSGPPLEELIAAAQRVQATGTPLQISNWQKPLTNAQIDRLLGELDPRGLKVTLQADSLAEAERLYGRVKEAV